MYIDEWIDFTISQDASIREAMEVINVSGVQTCLIIDSGYFLRGVVTDGDIRRALLDKYELDTPISNIMNLNPVTGDANSSREDLTNLMEAKGINCIPIVDKIGRILTVATWRTLCKKNKYDNPVFIMAGGFGTRLRPLTDTCPKPMLKVGDKPMLEILLDRFISFGFSDFYISTHYMPEIIMDYFGSGDGSNYSITYIHEDNPLGTGGALGLLPDSISEKPLIMINGDILTSLDFEDLLKFHESNDSVATMCVREYEYQIPYGVIDAKDGKLINMDEKPIKKYFVNAGVYVINHEIIRRVKRNIKVDMPSLLESEMCRGNDVSVYPVYEYWLDIGRIDDYNRAQCDVKKVMK